MVKAKLNQCMEKGCEKPRFAGGFCEEHFEAQTKQAHLRTEALNALHSGRIDGALPTNDELHGVLTDIRKWWDRACRSINHKIPDPVLNDQAEYALSWCQSLATEIVLSERNFKNQLPPTDDLEHTKAWVFQRISELEAEQSK